MPHTTPLNIAAARQAHHEQQEQLCRQQSELQLALEKTQTGYLPESVMESLGSALRDVTKKLEAAELAYNLLLEKARAERLAVVVRVRGAVGEALAVLTEYLGDAELQEDSELTALALTEAREKLQEALCLNTSPIEPVLEHPPAPPPVGISHAISTEISSANASAAQPGLASCAGAPLVSDSDVIEPNSRVFLKVTPPSGQPSTHQLQIVNYQVGRSTKSKVWAKSDMGTALLGRKVGDTFSGTLFGTSGSISVISVY